MAGINLVIADNDEAYLDSFVSYMIRYYPHRFTVNTFSGIKDLRGYLEEVSDKVDILLISEDLEHDSVDKSKIGCFIILTKGKAARGEGEQYCINKYQYGDRLAACILGVYSEKTGGKFNGESKNKNTRVVSVFSPQGGSGKTSIALSACIQCARKGSMVFYLNLEEFNSTSAFLNCKSDLNFSNVIYYLKERSRNLALKIEASKCVDPVWGFHYFAPSDNDVEINEISFEDVNELIDQIKSLGIYDFIFIDMSSSFNARNTGLLGISDRILLVFGMEMSSESKIARFVDSLDIFVQKGQEDIRGKCGVILNRCRQSVQSYSDYESIFDNANPVKIPEIKDFNWSEIPYLTNMDNGNGENIGRLIQGYDLAVQSKCI
ncbi:MAG: AAA family ATPase [Clostridia bacterium]|nr:AAA family ATPase [Clostridia bacterium]